MEITQCPLCDSESKEMSIEYKFEQGSYKITCNICGKYIIYRKSINRLKEKQYDSENQNVLYKIASFVTEKNIRNNILPVIIPDREGFSGDQNNTFTFDEILAHYPETIKEKLDNILINLFIKHPKPGHLFDESINEGTFSPLFYADNDKEARFYLNALAADHFIKLDGPNRAMRIFFTPNGLNKIYEIQTDHPEHSKNVFVALDFNHKDAFYEAILPVLDELGFKPECLLENKNGESKNIDNEIMAGLRKAHFIIADLTNKNSGAYWEAGVGYGLGRPVILCCQKKKKQKPSTVVHFDQNHFSILFYEDFDELKSELKNWIEANGRIVIPKKR